MRTSFVESNAGVEALDFISHASPSDHSHPADDTSDVSATFELTGPYLLNLPPSQDPAQEGVALDHLEILSQHNAVAAAYILTKMNDDKLMELISELHDGWRHGWCL